MFVNQQLKKVSNEKIILWTYRKLIRELQSMIIFESSPCTWAIFVRRVASLVSAEIALSDVGISPARDGQVNKWRTGEQTVRR